MTSTTSPRSPRGPRALAGLLSLLPACSIGPGIIGDATATETDTDAGPGTTGETDGVDGTDTDCIDEGCAGELAVAALVAINYSGRSVAWLGSDTCDGPDCPTEVIPTPGPDGAVSRCQDDPDAQGSLVGAEEYCRFAGHLAFGLDVGFQGALDRSSYEQVRPRPDDPTQEEPYLWYADVVRIEGPGTAYHGDFHRDTGIGPDRITSVVNETCAARLDALGISWTVAELETLCVGTWDDGGTLRPLRMAPSMAFGSYEGILRTDQGGSCDTPDSGPDTCCSSCDYALGIRVAPYGVDGSGARRQVEDGTAIACDPTGDPLVECRDLTLDVDRSEEEVAYTYAWDGAPQSWRLPWYDKIRETHPDLRPAAVEVVGPTCTTASECDDGLECIGTNASGQACREGDDCQQRRCRAPWFGVCRAASSELGYCQDARFHSSAAASCLRSTVDFGAGSAGDRLASCDTNGDGVLGSGECCDPALGGAPDCDPLGQPNLEPIDRYDRHPALPPETACACEEGQPDSCAAALDAWCEAPLGTASDPGPTSPDGNHAVPLVTRLGGMRAEDAPGWMSMRIANVGNMTRGGPEACAEARGQIEPRTIADGWLANEIFMPELFEDHDLATCSGSSYRVIFSESDASHHLRTAAGAALDGRSEHVIETSQFRVVPQSLFPTDNLRIGACDSMHLRFSATYDVGPLNLRKLELHEGAADGPLVAGGPGCDPEASPAEVAAGAIPCLTIGVTDRLLGELTFHVDPDVHGPVLVPGTTYTVVVPGLDGIEQMADAAAYAAAFHDACGMPLVLGETAELREPSQPSFTVDDPCE